MESARTLNKASLLKLHYLYTLEMLGDAFCEDFASARHTQSKGILGYSPKNAKIGFVSQIPLLNQAKQFLPKKSAQMLEKMIQKVFCLTQEECCILSLFKTSQTAYDENLKQHIEILLSQIFESQAKIFILFGYSEIAQHLCKENIELGIPFKFKHKHLLVTHSFEALIRIPTLKKQTLQHLNTAKALL